MARGASGPAPGAMTVQPMVKIRKKVPMNSTRYFFMGAGEKEGDGAGSQPKGKTQRDFT